MDFDPSPSLNPFQINPLTRHRIRHLSLHLTLVRLNRLIELVRQDGGRLSVILASHPRLKNDLRRPSLEEIGARASIFSLEGIQGRQREYIAWVLQEAAGEGTQPIDLLAEEALALLAERLASPLKIEK
jgi:type II secretory pathway predicted ATPase ExeA